ncbi:Receptor-like protein kinase [Melia azedarach]|uniref:Receptor-like protein kinase n=1 Tax=Melia azedarach TaxID=155640 RepID=A0ACC1X8C4_MELAZ|nr:Receptor-like protein kinase [Melia azedarach]
MAKKLAISWVVFMMFLLACYVGASESEAQILIKFRSSLLSSNESALSRWNVSTDPCNNTTPNWSGLRCSGGIVTGLRLENMSLMGIIDIDTLAQLPGLRSLSFKNNSFDGPMPSVNRLTLRALYLSYNKFSGEIPADAFAGMNQLKKVHLGRNQFTGKIPGSLTALQKLLELSLEGNQFEGKIPNFPKAQLTLLNLSYNQLEGRIPASLSNFNATSFEGNKDLCGKPLEQCKSSKKKTIMLICVIAAAAVALAAITALSYIRSRETKTSQFNKNQETKALKKYDASNNTSQKEAQSCDYFSHAQKGDSGKLYFVKNDRERFDLQDLLRASAEVLGSGSFGSSYKAVLLSGPAMVVKRFRQMSSVGREDFHDHMRRLGSLSHPNLLPLIAFYYRKEEKLLVSDFVPNGSLANHLHAGRAPGQLGLDWPTRLKIIRGVAKGLAHLYGEFPGFALPHGHLKSSNVLLDNNFEPLLTDYALVPVVNKEHAQLYMVAYKSPEFTQTDRVTRKTDVWSLGILILELLTGKFPANYLKQGKGANADLATWVNSVVREEWTGEVFDKDMKGTKNGEGQMLKLLKIGMCCCEWNAERRWDLREAVERIMELKEKDNENDDYSSYASEDYGYSSRAMTDEDFSFSIVNV